MDNAGRVSQDEYHEVLDRRDRRIAELEAALKQIESKYAAIMKEPPEWVGMTPEQLNIAREAWYGASLIARRVLQKST